MDEVAADNKNSSSYPSNELRDDIRSQNEPELLDQSQNEESMEVHHHSHLEHKPKPWKEYLLEFVMMFLAVTLGFFAENIREHYVEGKRAEEYAHSLYDDLKVDTANIQRTLNEKNWIKIKYDSAQNIILSGQLNGNNELIYYVERYMNLNDLFTSQDVTYQQLRSSGSFRYMKNVTLYKEIANYYNLYDRYAKTEPGFGIVRNKDLEALEMKLFDVPQLQSLDNHKASMFYNLVSMPTTKLTPIKDDKESLQRFYLEVSGAILQLRYNIAMLQLLKSSATDILMKLKDEYQFD